MRAFWRAAAMPLQRAVRSFAELKKFERVYADMPRWRDARCRLLFFPRQRMASRRAVTMPSPRVRQQAFAIACRRRFARAR